MLNILSGFLQNEEGQGMIEYGLIVALIALAVFGALAAFGNTLYTSETGSAATVVDAMSATP